MDTRQLKHFVTVAETLHFGKAAERLNMTQPPLSQSIMALEKELGDALFLRTKRNVSLTPFGEQWLFHVKSVLNSMNSLPEIADRLRKGESGQLMLSFISSAGYNILPQLVSHFRERYPAVELVLTEATTDVQTTAIINEKIDAGIIIPPADKQFPAILSYKKIMSEPLIAAVPASWLAKDRIHLTQGKLCPNMVIDSPLIIFPQQVAPSLRPGHELLRLARRPAKYHSAGYSNANDNKSRCIGNRYCISPLLSAPFSQNRGCLS